MELLQGSTRGDGRVFNYTCCAFLCGGPGDLVQLPQPERELLKQRAVSGERAGCLKSLRRQPKTRLHGNSLRTFGMGITNIGGRVRKSSVLLAAGSSSLCCFRMPSLLANAGCRVSVLAPEESAVLASRYVAKRMPVRGGVNAVVRRLRELLQSPLQFDWVILGDEDIVAAVARRRSEAWAAKCFPVAVDGDAVHTISRKTAFVQAAQRAGIPVPASRVCHGAEEAVAAAEDIGFPLLLKANFGASGMTVWRIADHAELLRILPRAAGQPFTVQALLRGEAGVTEMVCDGSKPLAIVSSLMRGIDPAPFGPASARLYRQNPQAEAVAIQIAALTGFRGFCGFDWLQTDDGTVHAIEFHARPTLGFHMAHRAGVDFAEAARRLLDQRAYAGSSPDRAAEPITQAEARDALCLFFPKDFTRALRHRDVRGLLRWLPGITANDLPWRDPGLLWALVRRYGRGVSPRPVRSGRMPFDSQLTAPGPL